MDLTPFKLDIDELLEEFAEEGLTTLADMKRVWASRKFSFIYGAKPTPKSAPLFMQSLFAHAVSHMGSDGALSRRLGALYCLYCLYETQPYKPCFKIYLSLGELKRLVSLVADAKKNDIGVAPALVKRMLDRNIFLFGSVDGAGHSLSQRVNEIEKQQDKCVQIACEKLLDNTRIDDYLHMNLGVELDLKALKKMSTDYTNAKELAIEEASHIVGVDNVKHISEKRKQVGDTVEEIVGEWETQKEEFYKQTGITCQNELVAVDGFDELEHLLMEA